MLREVGTGDSLAGKVGVTVRAGVDVLVLVAVVVRVGVVAVSFEGVDEAVAARKVDDVRLRWIIR